MKSVVFSCCARLSSYSAVPFGLLALFSWFISAFLLFFSWQVHGMAWLLYQLF
jgi:hypothetical protein